MSKNIAIAVRDLPPMLQAHIIRMFGHTQVPDNPRLFGGELKAYLAMIEFDASRRNELLRVAIDLLGLETLQELVQRRRDLESGPKLLVERRVFCLPASVEELRYDDDGQRGLCR